MYSNGMLFLLTMYVTVFVNADASTVSFDAFPSEIKKNLTDAASMICKVSNNAQTDVRHISSIFISRGDGDDVASVTAFDPPTALADLGNLDVKGSLSALSGEGSIELSWKDPSSMGIGEYACTVNAVDSKGHVVVLDSQLMMTSVTPSMLDYINNINSKVGKQQQEIIQLQQDNQQLHQDNQQLHQDNQQLQDQLKVCSAKVAFQSSVSSSLVIDVGKTVVFGVTLLNDGLGYDNKTGTFTCTLSGLYVFNVHAQSHSTDEVCYSMKMNTETISSLWAGYTDKYESASMSAVVHMKAGDVVKVVTWRLSKLYYTGDLLRSNIFGGYLVRADGCQQ